MSTGEKIYHLIKTLWPINRSITGNGNRETLKILNLINPLLKIKKTKSNQKVFDWKIPLEWNVKNAYIENEKGIKIVDFKNNNLHLMGYSIPFKGLISYKDLKKKVNFIKSRPNTIPYTTSYYKKEWSFNMAYSKFKELKKDEKYFVNIESNFSKGNMNYGEILLPGKSKREILFSTYICHPSMANNELSGPAVSIFLSKWLAKKKRNYSYRFIFISETIGSINYISKNFKNIKKNVLCIFNLTCVGDNNCTSLMPSKYENTIADRIATTVLKKKKIKYKKYSWLKRGSDERQYMSIGVDIPTISIMGSKYGEYKEYHTSDDDLNFISSKGLIKSLNIHKELITHIEKLKFPKSTIICEPNLGKRGLYPSTNNVAKKKTKLKKLAKNILNFLSYADGCNSLEDISQLIKLDFKSTIELSKLLLKKKLITL